MTSGWYPYGGLPAAVQVLFVVVLAITVSSVVSVVVLRINAARVNRRRLLRSSESDYLWVFFVPALNEEVTVADSVARLQALHATHKRILVIDDGSEDSTAEILHRIQDENLTVLSRILPDARRGKAAALNAAWAHLHRLLGQEPLTGWSPESVIVVVVDADGRLSADAPQALSRHFQSERVAGVQSLVRIYNRRSWLTWAQDVEFGIFGHVYQRGRSLWGTANMGGNGQANRLAALDSVATEEGPWRHRLTEDQDIGVRLLQHGWQGDQDVDAVVEQQGVNSLRRLYRQRTRWAQGAFEALSLIGGTRQARAPLAAKLDMIYYLLTPVIQLATGAGLVGAVVLAIAIDVPFWTSSWPILLFYLGLSFGPALLALLSRGHGFGGKVVAVLSIVPYTVYAWLIFPVLLRALARHWSGRATWAKTAREPLKAGGVTAQVESDPPSS